MGSLPACWKVMHHCSTCHDRVGPPGINQKPPSHTGMAT
jgi:hypothetical protein